MRSLLAAAIAASLLGIAGHTDARSQSDARTVREWILQNNADIGFIDTDRYAVSYFDLNGDGIDEALVYLRSRSHCGTGGCSFYVLASQDGRWNRISRHTVTNLPIRVLPTLHRGWRDISVRVRIDAETSYPAALAFDGTTYPPNPSVQPARRLGANSAGIVVIDADTPLRPLDR